MDSFAWVLAAILAQVVQLIAMAVFNPKTRRVIYAVILVTSAIATYGWAAGGILFNALLQLVVLVLVVIAILLD